MDFEAYLTSKRIDSARFKTAEPEQWQSWKTDFDQMHPNSFTVQKFYLINPVRRKYQLLVAEQPKAAPAEKPAVSAPASVGTAGAPAKPATPVVARVAPKIPRPGMPKPIVPGATPPVPASDPPVTTPPPSDNEVREPGNEPIPPTGQPAGSEPVSPAGAPASADTPPAPKPARPVIPRPIIKPRPKTD